uniref:U11/U12 small nuclear ribonucleoprotein 48 kDa protein n=1 Tax=Erigeron canadensis TaxID=72917 RepID=UPI001CB8FB8E|nr:U11/U12 small nuclear ribonucleoprotein 48 kDa protein [Erigeron canadensis]
MDSASPAFTFLPPPPPPPPPPNPNPNPRITNSQPPNLQTTLSSLKHLIHLSESTLHSLSAQFLPFPIPPPNSNSNSKSFVPCQFNPNHHLPPSSLFHHHLICPDSPSPISPQNDVVSLPLNHPPTIPNTNTNTNQNDVVSIPLNHPPTIPNTNPNQNDVVSISLNPHHTSLAPNFFYLNSPAVVTFPIRDNTSENSNFTFPVVLFNECENTNDDIITDIDIMLCRLLASECFNVRIEIFRWKDYPSFYSYAVLRTILSCYVLGNEELKEWILVNSPFYGVVVDAFMRDHIFVLFKVCLKAIAREASKYLMSVLKGVGTGGSYRFECPVLVKVMMWLGEQFGVLYGEVNGKLFAVNMLKQSLIIASSGSLFNFGEDRVGESVRLTEEKDGSGTTVVLVSQVAAAVAALYQRAALETRIKGIRASRFVPAYQRVQEHAYISKMAEEERKKRPNYRPIIEHDGVLWNRGGNQDSNKNKSREELLAEERDYKRRRMSYRGKKMKRSTTQVMRDIIDEYMQEIKCANMGGQPLVESTSVASEPSAMSDVHADKYENNHIRDKISRRGPKQTSDISMRSERSEDVIKEKGDKQRHDEQHEEYFSKKTNGRRSSSRSHDHRQQDKQRHSRKSYVSNPDSDHGRSHVNSRRSEHKNMRSSSNVTIEFEDRYHPSKSHDVDDDDL